LIFQPVPNWCGFFGGLGVRPIQKKNAEIVTGDLKKSSGGVLMWGALIRLGQDLTLQGAYYCDVIRLYGDNSFSLVSRGKLCSVPRTTDDKRGIGKSQLFCLKKNQKLLKNFHTNKKQGRTQKPDTVPCKQVTISGKKSRLFEHQKEQKTSMQ